MKNNIYALLGLLVGLLSQAQANSIQITLIDAPSLKESKVEHIYLYRYIGTHYFEQDSVKVQGKPNEKLTFNIEQSQSEIYRIGISKEKSFEIFYSSSDKIDITLSQLNTSPSINANYKSHNEFRQYRDAEEEFQVNLQTLNKEMSNLGRQMIPQQQKDSVKRVLQKKYKYLINKRNQDLKNALALSSDTLIKAICKLFITDGLTPDNFFNNVDFNLRSLGRGDFLYKKIELYFNYVPVDRVSIGTELSNLFSLVPNKNILREAFYEASVIISYRYNKSYAEQFSRNYYSEFPQSPMAAYFINVFPPGEGTKAPEIISTNIKGETMKLSDLKGKVILIDFWASWCGPCKRELPYLVDAYNKYHDKGFEVFSVSLDQNKANWENAISAYGLKWPYHVSELKKFQAKAVQDYRVSGIPATFLIDENGVIIARNLIEHQLEQKLEQVFK